MLRAGNNGPVAGFLATNLATAAPITVGAAGHVDAAIPCPGAQVGDSVQATLVIEAGSAGLVVSGCAVTVADSVTVRFINPSAGGIGATTPHVDLFVLRPAILSQ